MQEVYDSALLPVVSAYDSAPTDAVYFACVCVNHLSSFQWPVHLASGFAAPFPARFVRYEAYRANRCVAFAQAVDAETCRKAERRTQTTDLGGSTHFAEWAAANRALTPAGHFQKLTVVALQKKN